MERNGGRKKSRGNDTISKHKKTSEIKVKLKVGEEDLEEVVVHNKQTKG